MSVIGESRQYHTLDGIRGIAALAIAVLHMPVFFGGWHLPGSFLAVDLFFVLSGFVLANAYERRFNAGMSWIAFAKIRIVRLYPLYLLSIVLGIGIALLDGGNGGMSLRWNDSLTMTVPFSLAMLPTPPSGMEVALYPLNPVLWTIFFELLINIVYAAIFPLLRRRAVLVAIIAVGGLAMIGLTVANGTLDGGYTWGTFALGGARVTFSFFLGVLLRRSFDPSRRVASGRATLLIVAIPLLFWLARGVAAELVVAMVVLPIIVWFGAHWEPRHATRLFSAIGTASYALYVLHKPLFQYALAAAILVLPVRPETLAPWIGVVFLGGLVIGSLLIDRFYDAPFRRWLTQRLTTGRLA